MKSALLVLISLLVFVTAPTTFAFTDVTTQNDEVAINYLFKIKIVEGYSDMTFRPSTSINRAELLKILVESRVNNVSSVGSNCFKDVTNDWYAKYVCYAKG